MLSIKDLDLGKWVIVSRDEIESYFKLVREAVDEMSVMEKKYSEEVSRLMQIICDASPDDDYLLVRQEADAIWARIHADNQSEKTSRG